MDIRIFQDASIEHPQLGPGAFFEVPVDGDVLLKLFNQHMSDLSQLFVTQP